MKIVFQDKQEEVPEEVRSYTVTTQHEPETVSQFEEPRIRRVVKKKNHNTKSKCVTTFSVQKSSSGSEEEEE